MYCPNCGENLRDTKYNFCPHCGSEISTIFEVPQLRIEREQYPSTPSSQSTMEYSYPQMIQQKVIRKPLGEPGVYSKRCLAFSITSLVLAFAFGIRCLFFSLMPPNLIGIIVALIASILGFGFGILAVIDNSEAQKLEPQNRLEKVGSVLMLIGIGMNVIPLTFIILLVISF